MDYGGQHTVSTGQMSKCLEGIAKYGQQEKILKNADTRLNGTEVCFHKYTNDLHSLASFFYLKQNKNGVTRLLR